VSLLALVDRLAALLERSDLTELEVEAGGTGITLRKASALGAPLVAAAAEAAPAPAGDVPAEAGATPGTSPRAGASAGAPAAGAAPEAVLAPLTGIFYASPSPGSPPFVVAGAEVVVGQVIGLIEAMKLFNEIKSDVTGTVRRLAAGDGELVKVRQLLIEVDPA